MKTEKGFTLVEVLLAAGILTVLVVSVSSLFILSMKTNAASGDQTECVALAQQRMEALRHVGYDTLVLGGDLATPVTSYHQYLDMNGDAKNDYVVTWQIQDAAPMLPALTEANLHVKALDVRCQALRVQNPKRVTLCTYRAQGAT
jgi:prepilin-type N-terminal cleavage/methylation domain-containing protein